MASRSVMALVRAGLTPSDAETVVEITSLRSQRTMDPGEITLAAHVTPDDVARAQVWWFYVNVEPELAGLLDA